MKTWCPSLCPRYTKSKEQPGVVYAIVLQWPSVPALRLAAPQPSHTTAVYMLGYPYSLSYATGGVIGMDIDMPVIPVNRMPCKWAWVLKLDGIVN